MGIFYDRNTNFLIGSADFSPFKTKHPSQTAMKKELDSMILSASGWRKVFTASGDEEDAQSSIGPENAALSVYIAQSFSQYIQQPQESNILLLLLVLMRGQPVRKLQK